MALSGHAVLRCICLLLTQSGHGLRSKTAAHRIPAVYPLHYFVASGGLVSYGADVVASFRQAASYVDRILHGADPATLPVQQSTKLELRINLKAAKVLGLPVPPTLVDRADEVIE